MARKIEHFASDKAGLREEMNMAYADFLEEGNSVTICPLGFALGNEMPRTTIAAIRGR